MMRKYLHMLFLYRLSKPEHMGSLTSSSQYCRIVSVVCSLPINWHTGTLPLPCAWLANYSPKCWFGSWMWALMVHLLTNHVEWRLLDHYHPEQPPKDMPGGPHKTPGSCCTIPPPYYSVVNFKFTAQVRHCTVELEVLTICQHPFHLSFLPMLRWLGRAQPPATEHS